MGQPDTPHLNSGVPPNVRDTVAAGGKPMSRVNGEKARANVARRNRTARREKDRARLAEIKAAGAAAKPAAEETKASVKK
jgi:hypothetical protein